MFDRIGSWLRNTVPELSSISSRNENIALGNAQVIIKRVRICVSAWAELSSYLRVRGTFFKQQTLASILGKPKNAFKTWLD